MEVKNKLEDRIYVFELNIMETRKREKYDVMSVPTILYFLKGKGGSDHYAIRGKK